MSDQPEVVSARAELGFEQAEIEAAVKYWRERLAEQEPIDPLEWDSVWGPWQPETREEKAGL